MPEDPNAQEYKVDDGEYIDFDAAQPEEIEEL
jgi:hypothetical protein